MCTPTLPSATCAHFEPYWLRSRHARGGPLQDLLKTHWQLNRSWHMTWAQRSTTSTSGSLSACRQGSRTTSCSALSLSHRHSPIPAFWGQGYIIIPSVEEEKAFWDPKDMATTGARPRSRRLTHRDLARAVDQSSSNRPPPSSSSSSQIPRQAASEQVGHADTEFDDPDALEPEDDEDLSTSHSLAMVLPFIMIATATKITHHLSLPMLVLCQIALFAPLQSTLLIQQSKCK